ncbi:MAG: tRNA preQ1(34) S-adenosylmethionine ribosyltransferase-isomerase QueA [Pseudomonadota bacterium]
MNRPNQSNLESSAIALGFEIPCGRIARRPPAERDASRLLVYRRGDGGTSHHGFRELPELLPKNSLLVLNNTQVTACRLVARKSSGGKLDLLVLRWLSKDRGRGTAEALIRGSGRGGRKGTLFSRGALQGEVLEKTAGSAYVVRLWADGDGRDIESLFSSCAAMPIPPYLRRPPDREDLSRYQTVYASAPGSIAAHTAGLHFTQRTLDDLRAAGFGMATITLNIGEGTFNPIRTKLLRSHAMHRESFTVSDEAAGSINAAMESGKTIIPVGTSCVRTLEGLVREKGAVVPWSGSTDLFITPGFSFLVTGAMITNFHLPASTPLALVMALAGIEEIRAAYRVALDRGYRFYSYGDSMLII